MVKSREIRRVLGVVTAAVLLSACHSGDAPAPARTETGWTTVWLQLLLPSVEGEVTRAPGDPGTGEVLAAPTYAYIYFVNQLGNLVDLRDEDENVIPRKVTLSTLFGTPAEYTYSGRLKTEDDRVFYYPLKQVKIPSETTSGHFYVVASNEPLKYGGDLLEDVAVANETAVQNLKIDLYDATMQGDLKNIYSTPYNYTVGSPARYYASYTGGSNNVIELMLYHVAARVDVKWNVVGETFQLSNKVSTMAVRNLKQNDCYLFRPTENASHGAGGYDIELKTAGEVSRQWYGRASFYTIPYAEDVDGTQRFTVPLDVNGNTTSVRLT